MPNQQHCEIQSNDLPLEDIFKYFYAVPDFQREYVWQRDHVEKLLEDVNNEFFEEDGSPTDAPEYFIGSIVVCRRADSIFELIDGQQRMTTAYLVLCAIRDRFMQLGQQVPDPLKSQIADSSTDSEGETVFRYRVDLLYEDSKGILREVAEGNVPAEDPEGATPSVRNILQAYRTIMDFLTADLDDDVKRLKLFMAAFTKRVKLIRIITPDLTRALKVFETINDRGVGLTSMDLLKNLLFMRVSSDQYPLLKERWKLLVDTLDRCKEKPLRFLRYYIMADHEVDAHKGIREDQIYEWFIKHSDACGLTADPLGFLEKLVGCAKAYADFIDGKEKNGPPSHYLANILALGGALRQHFILFLAGRHLEPALFAELCRHIESLLFTYILDRETSKTYERNFARWSGELRVVTDAESLRNFLQKNFTPELEARSSTFDFRLQELTQSRIQQYRMRYILAKLTQFIDEQAWGVKFPLDKYINGAVHIEHILSQKPTPKSRADFDKPDEYADYVERFGNLMLLEKTINTSVSNGTYEEKKADYRQSAFLLTKSIVEQPQVGNNTSLNRAVADLQQFETWDSLAIEARQSMLTRLARRVWNIPDKASIEDVVVNK